MQKSQVETAGEWLHSPDMQQRVEGAEQLAAYPTRDAEKLLNEAIATDPEASVRSAAILSLESFQNPSKDTVKTLYAAVEDDAEEVQGAAINALQRIYMHQDIHSKPAKAMLADLKKKLRSSKLKPATREQLDYFIKDQIATP